MRSAGGIPRFDAWGGGAPDPGVALSQLAAVVNSCEDAVIAVDLGRRITTWNAAAERIFGYAREEAIGQSVTMLIPPETGDDGAALLERVKRGESVEGFHTVRAAKDGRRLHVTITMWPVMDGSGRVAGASTIVRDLTARHEWERTTRLLAAVVESSDDAIITKDLSGVITSWNNGAERIFGYTAAEAVGRSVTMLIPPESSDEEPTILSRIRAGEPVDHYETIRIAKDGRRLNVSLTVSPLRDAGGRIVGASKIARDVTFRHDWARARGLLAAVVESSEDAIVTKGLDGTVMTWNAAAERMFGYTAAEMIGESVFRIIPEDRRAEEARIMDRLRTGERVEHFETVRRTRDGRLLDISLTVSPLRGPDGRIIGASKIARDITERRRTERLLAEHREHLNDLVERRTAELRASEHRLRMSERMASLGTLAAGLGHDMGNLLLPVRMRLEAMAEQAPAEFRADLQAIEQTVKYLGQLTSGLRLLAHDPGGAEPLGESTRVAEWWPEVAALMRTAVPHHVTLVSPRGDAPAARISKTALTQAVFNLVQNAGDALRERAAGRVEVWAEAGEHVGEGLVRIGVSDDGPGMTEEVRNRCLEPFYSTKPRGISTGLGLSLVQGVVQRAGGMVEVRSAPGEGTTVALVLPAARPSAPGVSAPNGRPRGATAVVSLADSRARSYVKQVLRAMEFELDGDGAGAGAADAGDRAVLWVTDGSAPPGSVAAFLEGDPRRRVVVFGEARAVPGGTRVVTVAAPLQPTVMRDHLVRAAREALNS